MLEHKLKGEVVFVSSVMALTGFAGYTAYAGSKWAVRGICNAMGGAASRPLGHSLTRPAPVVHAFKSHRAGLADSLRNELAGSGIRVFHFMPANIDTPGFKTEVRHKARPSHARPWACHSCVPFHVR